MAKIKCVIFDFGDTLVDSSAANKKAHKNAREQKALAKFGFKHSKNQLRKAVKTMQKQGKKLSKEDKKDTLVYSKLFLKALGIRPSNRIAFAIEMAFYNEREKYRKLMPNALKLLEFLKKKGIAACVITNTVSNHNQRLAKKLGIKKYFRHFIMSCKFGSSKSELKIFKHLLEKLNKGRKSKILPKECLMIGNDAEEDGAAKKAGMKTAIFTKRIKGKEHLGKIRPDYLIKNLKEIERIVQAN